MFSGKIKYYAAGIASTVIWGFFSIPLRSIHHYPSEQILYYRVFSSLILTWLIILSFRHNTLKQDLKAVQNLPKPERKQLIYLILLAGFLITGNWFTYIYAVNNVSLTSGAFAYMVCPIITAVGGFLILKEQLSTLKVIAVGIAVCSILLLARGSFVEVAWSVFVASLYAFYLIIQRAVKVIDKLNMLGVQLILSTLIILPLFILHYQSAPHDIHFWITILIISFVFTIVPLFLSLYALVGIPSSTLGILIYLNPVIAFAVAFFYFHEPVTLQKLAAYFLLLIAVLVFNWGMIRELVFKLRN